MPVQIRPASPRGGGSPTWQRHQTRLRPVTAADSVSGAICFASPRLPGHRGLVIEAPEPDCWLHPDLEVRDSPIEGRGLFARAAIPGGTVVSRIGGRLVSR